MRVIPHSFKIGEEVSYSFNGDSYPDGVVAKITAKRLVTSTGKKYSLSLFNYRDLIKNAEGKIIDTEECKKESFRSVNGGTWCLVHGHVREWNPEF